MRFPSDGRLKVGVHDFSFINFFINISATIGNNTFIIQDSSPATFTLTIPDGSYSVTDLSTTINNLGIVSGLADGLIQLVPDFSTNKVLVEINALGYRVSFAAGTPYTLLGGTLNQFVPAVGYTVAAAYSELLPNDAAFNSISNVYLHTTLSNNSIFGGNAGSNVIASITPVASIGSTQSYLPNNILYIDAHELINTQLSNLTVYLTDQNNNSIELVDDFAVTLIFVHDPIFSSVKTPA
jgi:hypothetical protein